MALQQAASKVPEVTLGFWIIKIAATTLGETGGDTVTMTLNWGYLAGTALFLCLLAVLVFAQMLGTALGDWIADTGGLGYEGGALVFGAGLVVIAAFYFWTNVSRVALFW